MSKKPETALSAVLVVFLIVLATNRLSGMAEEKLHSLNGQWEFYWQKLLTPEQWAGGIAPAFIQVPGSWKRPAAVREGLSRFGYGTYRTTFKVPPDKVGTMQALTLHYVGSAR